MCVLKYSASLYCHQKIILKFCNIQTIYNRVYGCCDVRYIYESNAEITLKFLLRCHFTFYHFKHRLFAQYHFIIKCTRTINNVAECK